MVWSFDAKVATSFLQGVGDNGFGIGSLEWKSANSSEYIE